MKNHGNNLSYQKEKKKKKNPKNQTKTQDKKTTAIELKQNKTQKEEIEFERVEIPEEVIVLNNKFNKLSDKEWTNLLVKESDRLNHQDEKQKTFCDNFVKNIADANTDDIVEYIMIKNDEVEEKYLTLIQKKLDSFINKNSFNIIIDESYYFVRSTLLGKIFFNSVSQSKKFSISKKITILKKIILDASNYDVVVDELRECIKNILIERIKQNELNGFTELDVDYLKSLFEFDNEKRVLIKEILYGFLKKGHATEFGVQVLQEYIDIQKDKVILKEIFSLKYEKVSIAA